MKQRKTVHTRSIEPIKTVDGNGVTKTTTFTTTSTTIYNDPNAAASISTPPPLFSSLSPDVDTSDVRYSSFSSQPRLKASAQSGFLSAFSGKSEFVFQALILGAICILAFMCRLFSVVRYESVIHEFDPWFNFRTTRYLVAEGFYNFHNWSTHHTHTRTRRHPPHSFNGDAHARSSPSPFARVVRFDEGSWYPLGRFIGGTLYPGLMWTAAAGYHFLHLLHFTVDIRNVCVLLAPFMAGNTAIATYLLTKECWNGSAGIYAAIFVAIAPGYISRSVAGSYDNEACAIFALVFCFYLWVKVRITTHTQQTFRHSADSDARSGWCRGGRGDERAGRGKRDGGGAIGFQSECADASLTPTARRSRTVHLPTRSLTPHSALSSVSCSRL